MVRTFLSSKVLSFCSLFCNKKSDIQIHMYESNLTFVFDIYQLTEIYMQRIVAPKSDSYFKTRLLMACYWLQ